MSARILGFEGMEWSPGSHPLERKKVDPGSGAVLLEFLPGFEDPNGCVNGHTAIILEGSLTLETDEGTMTVEAGNGFHLEPGARHRASNRAPAPVRLFILSRPFAR